MSGVRVARGQMGRRSLLFATALAATAIGQCGAAQVASRPLGFESDAYVWQRRWTPPLLRAVRESAPLLRAWRVLTLELDRHARSVNPAVAWSALADTGRPIVATVRLDIAPRTQADLPSRIAALAAELRGRVPGLTTIEIDHDSPTARLASYATFLARVRETLPPGIALAATALPTWLGSPNFGAFAARTDEVVMQLHALEGPLAGLFDPDRALRWAQETARQGRRPFRVALPIYGSRVVLRSDGGVLAVESEVPALTGLAESAEIAVAPASVADFLARLAVAPPDRLKGLAWFRLPLPTDERSWSPSTWHGVLRGESPVRGARITLRPGGHPGLYDVVASADPVWDVPLPRRIDLDPSCRPGDGANGFTYEHAAIPSMRNRAGGLLRAGRSRVLGWVRCPGDTARILAIHA